jgi:hypothetical protein
MLQANKKVDEEVYYKLALKIALETLESIEKDSNYLKLRKDDLTTSLIKTWTKDGAGYMHLKGWNHQADKAESALKEIKKLKNRLIG